MFRFGKFTLDIARGSLRIADREIDLRPKSYEVLRCLIENADRLVTKDELIKRVWPNVVVADESPARCVSEVREALRDSDQSIIKTVPRRGYRFTAPLSQAPPDFEAAPHLATKASERLKVKSGADWQPAPSLLDRPSIAVLPFANLGGGPQQEYFSDGISGDIITELSRFSELIVIARNSTFQYKGKAVDARQVGRDLGVRYILEGSIRRSGDRVRINAQLIDAITGANRWADRYDRELSDVFAVQDEVTRTIVALLIAHVNNAEAERTLLKPPKTWEAYDYYMRGADVFGLDERRYLPASLREARRLLERSLSIDPGYARAYALLSWTYVHTYVEPLDGDYLNPRGLDHAYELAKKAVQLDANLPQAHIHLGWVLLFKRRFDAAIAEWERARALNPNFIDHYYGLGLVYAGEPSKAIEILEANSRLDPFQHHASHYPFIGHAYYMCRRHAEAVPPLREGASRSPNIRIIPLWLAASYAQLGQLAEAHVEAAEVLHIEPGYTIEKWKCTAVYRNPEDAEHLFDGLRKAGLPEK
jgi:adenylate cyclase